MPYGSDPYNLSAGTQIGPSFRPTMSDAARIAQARLRQMITLQNGQEIPVTGAPEDLSDEDKAYIAQNYHAPAVPMDALGNELPAATGGLVGGPQISVPRSQRPIRYSDVAEGLGRARGEREQTASLALQKAQDDARRARARADFEDRAQYDPEIQAEQERLASAKFVRQQGEEAVGRKNRLREQFMGTPGHALPADQAGPVQPAVRGLADTMNLDPFTRALAQQDIEAGNPLRNYTQMAAQSRLAETQAAAAQREAESVGAQRTTDEAKQDEQNKLRAEKAYSEGDLATADRFWQMVPGNEGQSFQSTHATPAVEDFFTRNRGVRFELNTFLRELKANPSLPDAKQRFDAIVAQAQAAGVRAEDAQGYLKELTDAILPQGSPGLQGYLRSPLSTGVSLLPGGFVLNQLLEHEAKKKLAASQQRAGLGLPENY